MNAYKNILFPFDSQIRSEQSFEHAIKLALKHRSNLIFLHTIRLENAELKRSGSDLRKQMNDTSGRRRQEIEERFDLASLENYEFHSEIGFLASRVLLKIKEIPIDLIIIEKELLSELDAEAHYIKCPILVIPSPIML